MENSFFDKFHQDEKFQDACFTVLERDLFPEDSRSAPFHAALYDEDYDLRGIQYTIGTLLISNFEAWVDHVHDAPAVLNTFAEGGWAYSKGEKVYHIPFLEDFYINAVYILLNKNVNEAFHLIDELNEYIDNWESKLSSQHLTV